MDPLHKLRPDVVHLCTPRHLHASLAADFREAGVCVIVEKPLAHTVEEGTMRPCDRSRRRGSLRAMVYLR